jgi:hypothetical protein
MLFVPPQFSFCVFFGSKWCGSWASNFSLVPASVSLARSPTERFSTAAHQSFRFSSACHRFIFLLLPSSAGSRFRLLLRLSSTAIVSNARSAEHTPSPFFHSVLVSARKGARSWLIFASEFFVQSGRSGCLRSRASVTSFCSPKGFARSLFPWLCMDVAPKSASTLVFSLLAAHAKVVPFVVFISLSHRPWPSFSCMILPIRCLICSPILFEVVVFLPPASKASHVRALAQGVPVWSFPSIWFCCCISSAACDRHLPTLFLSRRIKGSSFSSARCAPMMFSRSCTTSVWWNVRETLSYPLVQFWSSLISSWLYLHLVVFPFP